MSANLFFPMISYNHEFNNFRPGAARADWREPQATERHTHTAGDGSMFTYFVGDRKTFEITFVKQTRAQIDGAWQSWWDVVKSGPLFWYHHDDSYYYADGTVDADGTIDAGELQTAGTDVDNNRIPVKVDMDAFEPVQDIHNVNRAF